MSQAGNKEDRYVTAPSCSFGPSKRLFRYRPQARQGKGVCNHRCLQEGGVCGGSRWQVFCLGQAPTEHDGAALTDKSCTGSKRANTRLWHGGDASGCRLEDLLQVNRHLVGSNEETWDKASSETPCVERHRASEGSEVAPRELSCGSGGTRQQPEPGAQGWNGEASASSSSAPRAAAAVGGRAGGVCGLSWARPTQGRA